MLALIKKEIRLHFASPIFPVTAALFLFLTGFAFTAHMTQASPQQLPEASIRGMIYFMAVILLFLSPFLTMRSFAEERKSGTMELLKTSPLSDLQIVIAKYLGVVILLFFLLLLTVEFPVFIAFSGHPDKAPMVLAYVGLFLLGASLCSIGLFASVLTQSQMLAAILAFIATITLWFLGEVGGWLGEKVSLIEHIHSFSLGVVDGADLVYYLLFIFVFLFLTVRILEAERWYGTKTLLLTASVIVVSLLLYRILERKNFRWDLTANRDFTLSEQTEKTLKNLRQEVHIIAFFGPGEDLDDVFIRRKVNDILREYTGRSTKISYQMVDTNAAIELATQNSIVTDGTIVFQSGKNRKEIYKPQLFDYSGTSEKSLPAFIGEGLFTNALIAVTRDKQNKVCLLQGHEERKTDDTSPMGFSRVSEYLTKNNYATQVLSFVTFPKIPKDCDLLLIASPRKVLPPPEDSLIRDWIKERGKMLFLSDAAAPNSLPVTLQWLQVTLDPDLVLDPTRHFLLGAHFPAPVLSAEHEITKGLQEMNPILSTARSLSTPEKNGYSILLSTSPDAWGETTLKERVKQGPLTLGVAIARDNSQEPMAVIVGDADLASNGLIQAPGNLDLFLNMVGWLVGDKGQISIRPKTPEFRNLTLTPGRARFIAYFSQLIYPLMILLAGGFYWLRRRYR